MIEVQVTYPWGKEYIHYDEWQMVCGIRKKGSYNDHTQTCSKFATQDEYDIMMDRFLVNKSQDFNNKNFKEYNSHYYEYECPNGEIYSSWIIGFLSDKHYIERRAENMVF